MPNDFSAPAERETSLVGDFGHCLRKKAQQGCVQRHGFDLFGKDCCDDFTVVYMEDVFSAERVIVCS